VEIGDRTCQISSNPRIQYEKITKDTAVSYLFFIRETRVLNTCAYTIDISVAQLIIIGKHADFRETRNAFSAREFIHKRLISDCMRSDDRTRADKYIASPPDKYFRRCNCHACKMRNGKSSQKARICFSLSLSLSLSLHITSVESPR